VLRGDTKGGRDMYSTVEGGDSTRMVRGRMEIRRGERDIYEHLV